MRGRFTPAAAADEWCERRLLARIHHYTVKRLRAEIEPVAARDFLRFLLSWQRVAADARMEGPDAVDAVVGQLEGFEAPAGAWETEILPARLAGYEPAWLDDRCLAGRIDLDAAQAAQRGAPTAASAARRRCAPRRSRCWRARMRRSGRRSRRARDAAQPGARAQAVADFIRASTARRSSTSWSRAPACCAPRSKRRWPSWWRSAWSTSDSFGGLRALLVPSGERRPDGERPPPAPHRERSAWKTPAAGRWCAGPSSRQPRRRPKAAAVEHIARTLLRRYGVVFWRLLEREADWLPPWRDLLRVYRHLERRGEIRGGRFVAGFSGRAVRAARRDRHAARGPPQAGDRRLGLAVGRRPAQSRRHPDARARSSPRLTGNRLLYRDGIPVALLAGGEVQFLETLDAATEWEARKALLRRTASPPLPHHAAVANPSAA